MGKYKSSAEITAAVQDIGVGKGYLSLKKQTISSALAGIYIGFGAALALKVTGNLPPDWGNIIKLLFGLTFPIGLLMVITAGASLFTGDVMYLTGALASKKVSLKTWLRYLTVSYLGNFLGSLFLVLLIFQSKIMLDPGPAGTLPLAEAAINLANAKCSLPFLTAFLRGILCNWLVCLAIFMSLGASSGVSKAFLMWPPITAFVVLGMEHSVANMFFIPLGIFLGNSPPVISAGIQINATPATFLLNNLIPVTLGNILGGSLFMILPYLFINSPEKKDLRSI
jgi:formate/nitrite transporter